MRMMAVQEHKADVADRDAARFFFEDLAHVNEATSSKFDDEILHGECTARTPGNILTTEEHHAAQRLLQRNGWE